MINTTLCTHITYAFIGLTADGQINPLDAETGLNLTKKIKLQLMEMNCCLRSQLDIPNIVALKQQKPSLKLLVAMGGWKQGSTIFSAVCNDNTLRQVLVNNIYDYLITNKLDGIDIDWEYPAQRGGIASDKVSVLEVLSSFNHIYCHYIDRIRNRV